MGKVALVSALFDILVGYYHIFHYKEVMQIDWSSYITQADGILGGTYDYSLLHGPKGPIAYMGGHAYLYAFLGYLGINYSFLQSQILWGALHVIYTYVQIAIVEHVLPKKK